ncbi:DUF305 domain-containing protein [Bosea sp. (in: a-proteobacteria)]|uniref:CopM family metallochaperone n=1 Tax=Bosea sp. (in: a-proteobacteria) TaxID=1871050 RepID=UPI003B3A61D0
MNRYVSQTAALVLGLCLAAPAFAQQGHQHGAAPASRTKAETASTQAYKAANMKMHKDMDIAYSGDADVDFLRGMIPHHQGAIEMAKIVLSHGKDPEVRKLAEAIVRDQEKEVAMMREMLKKLGK